MPMPRPTCGARGGELSERALGIVLLAPMVLVLLLVIAYPLADSLWLSLHRVNLAHPEQGQPFVGLGNYLHAFRQPAFWASLSRTLYFTLLSVALEVALGLLFAVLLNERFRGNLGARLALIFPWALLTVSNGVLWAWILNPTYGVANALLMRLGVLQAPKAWLSDTFWTMHVVILADVWKMVPTMTLLLLAGLQPIAPELYEAAAVDGATRWQKFSRITLPLLRPVILVAVVLQSMGAFRVFDIIYVLTGNGGPADSTKVLAFYAYDQAFQYLFFGYGAAVSWLITACMLLLIVIYMHWLRAGER
ncbi:MAG: sugar ABC transporter permease [Candidatus Tectomicrobia bacterium]|uniref:Sugar ABC transporter permease n=1 Tax=Tectimicrobiota bacterium TaxID=2528274 RepID=A0A937W272_UNCTE|nr:sugar ABC transporter permease [Candidatus Tectomicrobia bacterium]